LKVVRTVAVLLALSGCSPVNGDAASQRTIRGALSAMAGPLKIRGVSATPDLSVVYISICREDAACAIYAAGEGDRLVPVLSDPEWDYLWVAATEDNRILAMRTRPGSEMIPDQVSEIVRYRPGDTNPEILRSEAGRVTSLHSLGGGAFAYFVSAGLRPVQGCHRTDCRYMPVAQRLVVVDAEGAVVGTIDDVVDGLAGEAFHPWGEGLWLTMPYNSARDRQLPATITAGPAPVLTRYTSTAELAATLPPGAGWPEEGLQRFDMIAEPFRVLGTVALLENADLTRPSHAVLVEPTVGPRPRSIEVRPVYREGGQGWRAERSRTYRF
jgi:hypothetical protein